MKNISLNPCFNGCASQPLSCISLNADNIGLNPCFNGCASQPPIQYADIEFEQISLNPCFNGCASQPQSIKG